MHFTTDQILTAVAAGMWPFARIAGLCMVAPVFGGRLVPARVRILFAVALTVVLFPHADWPVAADVAGLRGVFGICRELLIGIAMGFIVQMVFDAMVIAGQTTAMSMGLGFATMVDPQRGSVPVLGQFYVVLTTLLFLALNAHLALLQVLVESFTVLPPGTAGVGPADAWSLVTFGSRMFAGAMQVALPAVTAILIVNIAFGVMSRAAPTLNLFAVGFPITMLLGFVVLSRSVGHLGPAVSGMLQDALRYAASIGGGG